VARDRTVLGFGRALSDGDGIDDLTAPLAASAALLGSPNHSPRSQMRDELLLEHASRLNEETSVDRFVRDLHPLRARVSPLQPARDLFRRPIQAQLLGHKLLQSSLNRQSTGFRATGVIPGSPIGFGRAVRSPTAMASDFSAHRGRSALDRGCDPPHRLAFREATGDLLAFGETEGPVRTATSRGRDAAAAREDVIDRPSELPERSSDVLRRLPTLPSLPEFLLLRTREPPSAILSHLHHLLTIG
jgi:hypothetical protein